MAFANFAALKTRLAEQAGYPVHYTAFTTTTGLQDATQSLVPAATNPPTSGALSKTSDRAINGNFPNGGTNPLVLIGAQMNGGSTDSKAAILIDNLAVSSGLDGTIITTQTTNLPTAALPRNVSGDGVIAGLIIHVIIGTTATTFTVSYTNQAGVAGRTSIAQVIGGTTARQPRHLVPIPLQSGDTGVRSVESVTLAGTTGTIGNFGILLYKPIALFAVGNKTNDGLADGLSAANMTGFLAEIPDDACLSLLVQTPGNSPLSAQIMVGEA